MAHPLVLVSFKDFAQAFDLSRYRPVPDDWAIAVSDVVGSTQAIARGRYKDVNMAGAATIACVLNASGRDDLPFAFGGDGGVVLVPPEFHDAARTALRATRRMIAGILQLDLRCSLIPVAEVRKRGRDVLVASHDLGSGRMLAMLAGGGIETAEKICKAPDGAAFSAGEAEGEPDLTGLSCRWEPLVPENGVVAALVVHARDEGAMPAVYREIYGRIAALAGMDSPAKVSALHLRWPPRHMGREAAMQGSSGRFKRRMRILLETAVDLVSSVTGKTFAGFNARDYKASLSRHSDYRKYADSLRMVIDCTQAQADAISAMLEAEFRRGAIDYGIHTANAALMTCFVRDTREGGHIHFIDGADGGYALAAFDMKRRMAL